MRRRVRQKGASKCKEKRFLPDKPDNFRRRLTKAVDWTSLPDDVIVQIFSLLNYRDRASLSSSCRTMRNLGSTPCLWDSLDLRAHTFDAITAAALSSRCSNLRRLRFRGAESADAIICLKSRGLREICADSCGTISDASLSMIAARHEMLETLQLEPGFFENLSSHAIRSVALFCPRLRRLRLSGMREIDSDAISALAKTCPNLIDIAFMDCLKIDETALANVASLRFLSVAGTSNLNWGLASHLWSKLPHLVGLDVSRTDIGPDAVSRMLLSFLSLRALCALNCPHLDEDPNFAPSSHGHGGSKGKLLLSLFSDVFKGVASLFPHNSIKERNVFSDWRNSTGKDKRLEGIMTWVEWILSHSLLRIAEGDPPGLYNFWVTQGAPLLLSLMRSSQEDVQERAVTALATFEGSRAEAVMEGGGVQLLLNLATSSPEGLQAESAKAIANLSVNTDVARSVADEGGITILVNLARSINRLVAEEAAGGLRNLSVFYEHKGSIAEAGGVKVLVDLILQWSTGGEGVLERAAGALSNLAADDKCSLEVLLAGGVHALVMLARKCKFEGVQEQAARALANLTSHDECTSINLAVGQDAEALEALVQLAQSPLEGIRKAAAGALWNVSLDNPNREAIAAAGGSPWCCSPARE